MTPDFTIENTKVYTNSLLPLRVTPLTSNSFSNLYYLWDFGDGDTSNESTPEHTYTQPGVYNVSLTQFLSSGDAATETKPITAYNLIPNLLKWNEESYSSGFLEASVKTSSPFVVESWNSYQTYDDNMRIDLYVEKSRSIPYDGNDKLMHYKPNWRFLDVETGNKVSSIVLSSTKIYAYLYDDIIYLTTNDQPGFDTVFVGTSSIGKFDFVDDTPSYNIVDGLTVPSTIVASQSLSSFSSNNKVYISYPSLLKTLIIEDNTPAKLDITSNGVFEMDYLKFTNTKIPFSIRIQDSNDNYIKTSPQNSVSLCSYPIEIGFTSNVEISSYPSLSGNALNRYTADLSTLGGYYSGYFIPTASTTASVQLTARTQIDYALDLRTTKFGILADENSDYIYSINYIDGIEATSRRQLDINDPIVDNQRSNIFTTVVDGDYNLIYIDSDNDKFEKYDNNLNLLTEISLSSYSTLLSGHSSPAQVAIDKDNNYYITLFDAAKVAVIENSTNNITISDLGRTSQFVGALSGSQLYQPTAVDVLSSEQYAYISFTTDLNSNFIEKYSIDKTSGISLTTESVVLSTLEYQIVDMVSNKYGQRLYALAVSNTDYSSYIYVYDTTTDTLEMSSFVGYDSEFITLDTSQSPWVASKTLSSDTDLNLYKWEGLSSLQMVELSSFGDIRGIGGIAGDSFSNIWIIDSTNRRLLLINKDNYDLVTSVNLQGTSTSNFIAYGDWNGFRAYNKWNFTGDILTYTLTGASEPFIISDKDKYNLQKINEDFDMLETLKSYRTTEVLLDYDTFFDVIFGSIFGDKYSDNTFLGKNIYEKISNFVSNNIDVETANIRALKAIGELTGIDVFHIDAPRDLQRIIDIFSINFKKLWGDLHQTGVIEDYVGESIDISTYQVSATPPVNFLAREKFNERYTVIRPFLLSGLSNYPLSTYDNDWAWGLSVPDNNLSAYYDFYELNDIPFTKTSSIIDWQNELTSVNLSSLSSYENYFTDTGIVSTIIGEQMREGLGLFI